MAEGNLWCGTRHLAAEGKPPAKATRKNKEMNQTRETVDLTQGLIQSDVSTLKNSLNEEIKNTTNVKRRIQLQQRQ